MFSSGTNAGPANARSCMQHSRGSNQSSRFNRSRAAWIAIPEKLNAAVEFQIAMKPEEDSGVLIPVLALCPQFAQWALRDRGLRAQDRTLAPTVSPDVSKKRTTPHLRNMSRREL